MKLLVLCPGKIAKSLDQIGCFTDVLNYYLPKSLYNLADTTVVAIPEVDNNQLKEIFSTVPVDGYDAILTLGLRFYSKISPETTALLQDRFTGLLCQIHDGSRLDNDPVDITFTFKDDTARLSKNAERLARHKKYNEYMGWATDSEVNTPQQDTRDLRILVDHTNYGDNDIDLTLEVLSQIKRFIDSGLWQQNFDSVSVRRFDSGQVVDVDFNNLDIKKYNRTPVPFSEITKEHCAAHIFCVTHPESVGLVVLETATAGALPVIPKGFIPRDRLKTIRYVEWDQRVNWKYVMSKLDIPKSRSVALANTWDAVANRVVQALTRRLELLKSGAQDD
jgi:uncharacterized ubiquitin-like protein YukD